MKDLSYRTLDYAKTNKKIRARTVTALLIGAGVIAGILTIPKVTSLFTPPPVEEFQIATKTKDGYVILFAVRGVKTPENYAAMQDIVAQITFKELLTVPRTYPLDVMFKFIPDVPENLLPASRPSSASHEPPGVGDASFEPDRRKSR